MYNDEDNPYEFRRELPVDISMEQTFLGSCLLNNAIMDRVVDFLHPEHFANELHADMYEHMVEKFNHNKIFTPMSMKALIENRVELPEDTNAGVYLAHLAAQGTPPKVAEGYARGITDYWVRRQVIQTTADGQQQAYNLAENTGSEIIDQIQHTLSGLSGFNETGEDLMNISDGMAQALEMVALAMADDNPISGITTGIDSLDRALGGLKDGQLIIIAGRPAMGKSALALKIATAAAQDNKTAAIFSIEMAADELALRAASDIMSDDPNTFTYFDAGNGDLTQYQYNALRRGADVVNNLPIFISDRGGSTVESVRMETRRLNRKIAPDGRKIDLIVIDYLQLMHMGKFYKGNRVQEISDMTSSLKRLAKEMGIPIVVLSQLNRGLEQRENKRPMLSDLRDSGAIEQDADTVIFVYRDHYYLKDQEPKKVSDQADWMSELKACEFMMEIILAKQRRGPTKTLRVECKLPTNTIRDFKQ